MKRAAMYSSKINHSVAVVSLVLLASLGFSYGVVEDTGETNYVNLLLNDLDAQEQANSRANASNIKKDSDITSGRNEELSQVKRFWGIPDASAAVGKIFNYSIPQDAFAGKVQRFEVAEAGEPTLPSWLQFDESTNTFTGIPFTKDVGQCYITVKAIGHIQAQDKPPIAKDVFSIEVIEEIPEGRLPELDNPVLKCGSGESITMASVFVDVGLDELNISERTEILKSISSFLKLPLKTFKIVHKNNGPAFDLNAILAGPGNAKQQTKQGGVIQWHVGCSTTLSPDHKEPLNFLEKAAEDGSLAESIGFPVVGWQVTSVLPKLSHREKRHIGGTPVPGVLPTRFNMYPHYTEDVDDLDATDETMIPESRVVPTMASPIFAEPSHHHRHHHGDPGYDRAGHYRPIESPQMTTSPTLRYHGLHTAYITPPYGGGGTPVIMPDRPTKYVSPSAVDELVPSRYFPEEHTPVIDGLESSMTTPVHSFTMTGHLASTFLSTPEIVTSEEIKPTKTKVVVETTKKPPGTPNFKPTIERRVQKLLMVAGKVWRYIIPSDTFIDMEDGDTRHLKLLFLTSERTSIPSTSWIQFDPEKQTLYALPLEEHIGKYEFILEAMDSEGATINDRLEIHVWQHQSARARHHEFTVNLKYDKWQYPITIDWNIEFARKLAKYFGDRNESNIAVQAVQTDPVIFTWSNDSLPAYPCPSEEISKLSKKLFEGDSEVNRGFEKIMKPDFKILDAGVNLLGVCHSPGSTTSSTHTNFAPMLRNPIEKINTTVGEILRFKVPDDTFYDFEDGSTRYLVLTFLTIESVRPPKSSWVQFDHKSQELYGLPFENDVGRHEFQLVAMDTNGLQINDVFIIEVRGRPPKKGNVEFSLHIDADYDSFSRDISQKVLVAWKLANLYHDPDPRFITVNSISKGSVVYAWTNNTLPYDKCPTEAIKKLVKNIINKNGTLSSKLTEVMLPEFKIIKADAMPLGMCLGEVTPTSVTVTPPPPPQKTEPATTSDDDIYITTIIPAVVIAVMLIIAAMVACFLYKKKRKGKMTMQDNNTFIGNRAPVIFGDEMEDKPDPAKPPVIMKDEKPPLAPPDYLRSSASSRDSTPQLDRIEQANARNASADLHTDPSPPYQPPPPFTTNRDSKNSRPKTTPTYRQPPPYMPPVPP